MEDAERYLLDELNKSLEDSRTLGRLASNTVIVFGTAVLVAHSARQDFVCGLFTEEGGFFTAIVVAAFGLWAHNLGINLRDQQAIGEALQSWGSADVKKILATNAQWLKRRRAFWIRLFVVGVLAICVWAPVVDVFSDPCGKNCVRNIGGGK